MNQADHLAGVGVAEGPRGALAMICLRVCWCLRHYGLLKFAWESPETLTAGHEPPSPLKFVHRGCYDTARM